MTALFGSSIVRKVIRKEVAAGGRFDFLLDSKKYTFFFKTMRLKWSKS